MLDVQKFISEVITQRSQVWRDYDRALSSQKELLNRFSPQFSSSGTVKALSPLTTENLPSTEVQAVIANLEKAEKQIAQAQSNIQQDAHEIERLKIKARNLIIILTATGVVVFGGLVMYVKNQIQNNNGSLQPALTNRWLVQAK